MKNFLLALRMIGPIISLVQQVEAEIPGKGQGKAKLDLILNTVSAAAATTADVADAVDQKDAAAIATGIVNATVLALNTAGIISK